MANKNKESEPLFLRLYTTFQEFLGFLLRPFQNALNWIRNIFKSDKKNKMSESTHESETSFSSLSPLIDVPVNEPKPPVATPPVVPLVQQPDPKEKEAKAKAEAERQEREAQIEAHQKKLKADHDNYIASLLKEQKEREEKEAKKQEERVRQAEEHAKENARVEAAVKANREKIEAAKRQAKEELKRTEEAKRQLDVEKEREEQRKQQEAQRQAEYHEKSRKEYEIQEQTRKEKEAEEQRLKKQHAQEKIDKKKKEKDDQRQAEIKKRETDPVYAAIIANDLDALKKLLSESQKIPLEYLAEAVIRNQFTMVEYLIDHVEDTHVVFQKREDTNPFLKQVKQRIEPLSEEAMKALHLTKDTQYFRFSHSFDGTALLYASSQGHVDMVRFFLNRIPFVEAGLRGSLYHTVIEKTDENSKQIIQLFFQKKISIPSTNTKIIKYAIESGSVDILKYSFHSKGNSYGQYKHRDDPEGGLYDDDPGGFSLIYGLSFNSEAWDKQDASNIIELVILHNQLEILEFFLEIFNDWYSAQTTVIFALKKGNLEAAALVRKHIKDKDWSKYSSSGKEHDELVKAINDVRGKLITPLLDAGLSKDTASIVADYIVPDYSKKKI